MTTAASCLKDAFSALLRGDLTERDRLCDRAEALLEAEKVADAVQKVLAVDFYVTRIGVAIPTKLMAQRVGVIQ